MIHPWSLSPTRRPRHSYALVCLWLCLLLALLARIWLTIHTHGMIDGDEAVVGIQAEHILRGERPLYFYGQPYMGSLEAYLMALLFAIAGPSSWTLRAEPILLSLVVVWLTWKLALALADVAQLPYYARKHFIWVATLLAAVSPLYDTVVELRTLGGYVETFVLMLWLLLSALQLIQRWHAEASSPELAWRWAGIGFLAGLGLWVDPLISSALLAVTIWIVGDRIRTLARRRREGLPFPQASRKAASSPVMRYLAAVVVIPAALLGFTPALIWGAKHQWGNILFIVQTSGDSSSNRLLQIYRVTRLYLRYPAVHVVGGALSVESSILAGPRFCLLVVGATCLLAIMLLVAISFLWEHPALRRIQHLAALPALFALCTAAAFCLSPHTVSSLHNYQKDLLGRYATPLMLVLPFFFATAFVSISMYLHTLKKRLGTEAAATFIPVPFFAKVPRGRLLLVAQGMLLAFFLLYLSAQAWTYLLANPGYTFMSPFCVSAPMNEDQIVSYLQQQHIRYAWASSWISYPVDFKTNERIIMADPGLVWGPNPSFNRLPEYGYAVAHARRPSILVYVPHRNHFSPLLSILKANHITYRTALLPATPDTDILIITPLNRTVPTSLLINHLSVFRCRHL